LKFGRKFDFLKETSRIQVVFGGFVDDTYQIVRLGAGIFNDGIKLPNLQRGFVSSVRETDCNGRSLTRDPALSPATSTVQLARGRQLAN
jgi:hypothetical protein